MNQLSVATTLFALWISLAPATSSGETPYVRCFQIAAERHQVPLDLLIAVAAVESNFDPAARSPANAHGIMQVRWPLTAKHLGITRVSELYNPCLNIDVGASYLGELLQHYDANEALALAAYNYGPTRLKDEGDIPFRVKNYVQRVFQARLNLLNTNQNSRANPTVDMLALNEFSSRLLAANYVSVLNRFAPSARLSISKQSRRQYVVYLDQQSLNTGDRLMLSRLATLH